MRHARPLMLAAAVFAAGSVVSAADALARTLEVGPAREFFRPSDAAKAARDGDEIVIDPGTYEGDVAVWKADGLIIRARGGRAHMQSNGAVAQGKAIWVIGGSGVTVSGIEFSGAEAADKNGAGIRLEGGGDLTVRDSVFHDNQMGILTGNEGTSNIVIESSEFYRNGEGVTGGGRVGHNIYIGHAASFILRFSSSHHAVRGHLVKSRAARNLIAYNELADMIDGASSYLVDLPSGGDSVVMGNVLQQGPGTENHTLISYAAERKNEAVGTLHVVNNTFINQNGNGVFVANYGTEPVRLVNNIYQGPGTLAQGPHRQEAFLHAPDRIGEKGLVASVMEDPKKILNMAKSIIVDGGDVPGFSFRDPLQLDFRLAADSPAIDRGVEAGSTAWGVPLTPDYAYAHPLAGRKRAVTGKSIDLGAYEFAEE